MIQTKKYLGIGQPLHYDTLREVFLYYFNDQMLNKEEILELLRKYLHGENSINKAYSHINRIISKNESILKLAKKYIDGNEYSILASHDKMSLIFCLVSLAFPVTYDIANILSVGLKTQLKLRRDYLDRKLTSIYGSNRSIYNALNALLPMFQELELITKDEQGLFQLNPRKEIKHKFINELYIYTDIKLSGSKSILVDDLEYRPCYVYFNTNYSKEDSFGLVKIIESRIGQGYLTI